jgi:mono/diheme cytochrome c family protein
VRPIPAFVRIFENGGAMARHEHGRFSRFRARASAAATLVVVAALAPAIRANNLASTATRAAHQREPPARLAETGLYADPDSRRVADDVLPYSPQYPLWSDGAVKQRWIRIPRGAAVDASDPDAWRFPPGTQLWKEFAAPDGRRLETRYMALGEDGAWRYATYAWTPDGREAARAPDHGVAGAAEVTPGVRYDLPSVGDCRACHSGKPNEVLGFEALQLSSDRDPMALHASARAGDLDLEALAARGAVRGLPAALVARPPRIRARSPRERAALGYLHGNCSSCHNARGPLAELGLSFEQRVSEPERLAAHATAVGHASRFVPPGAAAGVLRIAPGDPAASAVVGRTASRDPVAQMPPFGSRVADAEAVELLSAWIRELAPFPLPAAPPRP